MLLLTAQRAGEVARMRWADLRGCWWTIPADFVKNKRTHRVFLSGPTLELLSFLEASTGKRQWVFASPRNPDQPIASLSTAKRRYRAAAGLPDWRPHDLRRTAATHMRRPPLRLGRDFIKVVLNHAYSGVTAIYDRADCEPEMEHALNLWGLRLDEIVRNVEQNSAAPISAELPSGELQPR